MYKFKLVTFYVNEIMLEVLPLRSSIAILQAFLTLDSFLFISRRLLGVKSIFGVKYTYIDIGILTTIRKENYKTKPFFRSCHY